MQTVQKLEAEIKKVKKQLIAKTGTPGKKDLSAGEGSRRKKLKRLQRRRRVLQAIDARIAGMKTGKTPPETKQAAPEEAAAAKAPPEPKPAAAEEAAGES